MKITNNYNLPESLVRAISIDRYKKVGDISITEMLLPPQIRYLRLKHAEMIEEDAADRIWLLLGSSVHAILERQKTDNQFDEEKLTIECEGWKVSGTSDILDADGTLWDYKVTSVWTVVYGGRVEWEQQLNAYRVLWDAAGFNVKNLRIVAIFRDWSLTAMRKDKHGKYPKCPVAVLTIPKWEMATAHNFIKERVRIHKETEKTGRFPNCDEEDLWITKTGYRNRCEDYCNVNKFCEQYKQYKNGNNNKLPF